jgi:HK97 gp10 family phage protein
MNFRATSKFTPRDIGRLEQFLIPKLVAAVREGAAAVVVVAQGNAPVDTGELRDSIAAGPVEVILRSVQCTVSASAPHAGFIEFGTGLTGSGTYPYDLPTTGVPYTGSWIYDFRNQGWVGMAARPFLRPALDQARFEILQAYQKQGLIVK